METVAPQMPILYHYPSSPYSEKLRLALGMTGIQWGSVIVSSQPPRPLLDTFLMGYRRIPILQVGAHFYCDSKLAFDVLAESCDRVGASRLSNTEELLRQHAEEQVFFAVIAAVSPMRVLRFLAQGLGFFGTFQFLKDRAHVMKDSTIEKMSRPVAEGLVEDFVEQLNELLRLDNFLAGDHASYLDLCCYHPLWMSSLINRGAISSFPPLVRAWMQRVAGLGHGRSMAVAGRQLHDMVVADGGEGFVAEVSAPFEQGSLVSVAPTDYARNSTVGHLVAMDGRQTVIKRHLESGDRVFLHFPANGFEVAVL
jgi:glutathione S-transferase